MRRLLVLLSCFALTVGLLAQAPKPAAAWQARLKAAMPLLGHRNWILVVDSAYPLQSSPGIETVETGQDQIEVTRLVLKQINASIHVRPVISMDAELPFVPDAEAPGASAYRVAIAKTLAGAAVEQVLHDKLIAEIAEASKSFHVLVLKTTMTIPYTSVFIRLDCKYWGADEEKRMRQMMGR